MKLTIVVPCLNLWRRFTLPCLTSIRTIHDWRVVLVDNGSTDETRVEAAKLVSAGFQYCRLEANYGTTRSWNFGIRDGFEKGSNYVAVLNNDILLHPMCLDRLVERIGREDVVLVTAFDVRGAVALPGDVLRIASHVTPNVSESTNVHFSAFLLNQRCWESIGPFDESFYPAYFEDNDYHRRIQLTGLRAIVHPPAMFYHFGSRTAAEAFVIPSLYAAVFERNRQYYISKWGGPPGSERFSKPFGPD